jgi:hypothetical protein
MTVQITVRARLTWAGDIMSNNEALAFLSRAKPAGVRLQLVTTGGPFQLGSVATPGELMGSVDGDPLEGFTLGSGA